MLIMGLDLSLTSTGVCILSPGGDSRGFLGMIAPFSRVYSGRFGFGVTRKEDEQTRIERLIYIAKNIVEIAKSHNVELVGIENYAFSRHGANISSAELGGVVKSQLLMACKIAPTMVVASAARKDLFGTLKKKDGKVKDQVRAKLKADGYEFKNDDEMDAFVIALFTLRRESGVAWQLK